MLNTIEEAISELKKGNVIIVVDDEDRENEGDFLALAENITSDAVNFMIKYGRGLVCCPITREIADNLGLPMMVQNNTESHETAFTVSVDHVTNTTGISAAERADTMKALASKDAAAEDFRRPGHTFPLVAVDGGVLERPGHTEAAVDLARLCGSNPAGVICEIIKDDGTMARLPDLEVFAEEHGLKIVSIQDLIAYIKASK